MREYVVGLEAQDTEPSRVAGTTASFSDAELPLSMKPLRVEHSLLVEQ